MRARSVLRRRATEGGPFALEEEGPEAAVVDVDEEPEVDAAVEALEVLAVEVLLLLDDPAGAACTDGPA